jgi:hypothetical protein
MIIITTIISKVANGEARDGREKLGDMKDIWANVDHSSALMNTARSIIDTNNEKNSNIKDVSKQCKNISSLQWDKFEEKLLVVAIEALDSNLLDIHKKITEKKEIKKLTKKSNLVVNNLSSNSNLNDKNKLKELQISLKLASAELNRNNDELKGNICIYFIFIYMFACLLLAFIYYKFTN